MAHLLIYASQSVYAIERVEVQALLPGMAVVLIDGERRTLKTGNVEPDGVRLISSDSNYALIEINGEQKRFQLGTTVSTSYTRQESIKEQIVANKHGMFLTHGSINGQTVQFLVDTGATSVAMSAPDAKRLGIQYRLDGQPSRASTASGIASAWRIKLKTVKVGRITLKNIDAMVVDGNYPRHILLGMSFLEKLKVSKESNLMMLEQKR